MSTAVESIPSLHERAGGERLSVLVDTAQAQIAPLMDLRSRTATWSDACSRSGRGPTSADVAAVTRGDWSRHGQRQRLAASAVALPMQTSRGGEESSYVIPFLL
jgi:hypothetical protein